MARMTFGEQRIALGQDGTITIPAADDKADPVIVGQVMRDPESKKWIARTADKNGKLATKKTEHATRQAAFEALLAEHEGVKPTPKS